MISFLEYDNSIDIINASSFAGLLILLRGEFIVTFLIFLFLVLNKKKIKFILIYLLVPLLIISPYLIRNYKVFDTITITKSFGYNLWKGNNDLAKVAGNPGILSDKIKSDLSNIKDLKKHDLIRDEMFKSYALENLKNDPLKYFKLYIKKILSFFFLDLDSLYPNYYNFFHLVPKVLISILTLFGLIYYDKKKLLLKYCLIFIDCKYSFIFSFFYFTKI